MPRTSSRSKLALLEVAAARVEADVLRDVDAEAAEEAVVGLADAHGLDVVLAAGVQHLLRLDDRAPS